MNGHWDNNVDELAQSCDPNCGNCQTTATNCLTCPLGIFLNPVSNNCVTTCLLGYFKNTTTFICDSCLYEC
jgi:hypothetical protein